MEAPRPTTRCSLRVGRAQLDYAFTPTVGFGGTVEAYTRSGERVFLAESPNIRPMIESIRRGEMSRPGNVARVVTSYAADAYDGVFVAMWLLGRRPVVPHRSRTYRTAIVRRDGSGHPVTKLVIHRFAFSDGRLADGLSQLIAAVYGVTPEPIVP